MAEPWYQDGLKFRCTRCGNCCTGPPGVVWVEAGEVAAIAQFRGEDKEEVLAISTRQLGSRRSLREKANGDCVFFDRQQGCTIYPVRPRQCQTWPFWDTNIASPEAWKRTCSVCPGSGQGDLIPVEEITRRIQVIKMYKPRGAPMSELHRQVLEIYEEVDREVAAAGPVCIASGRCCRFQEYGHVLMVSQLEAGVLLAAAPSYDLPVSAAFCPFQKQNLCTAREPRPLGCRVYFCDPAYQEAGHRITEKYLNRLKALTREHGLDWHYAPLHHFLNNAPEKSAIG